MRRLLIAIALMFSSQALAYESGQGYAGLQLGQSATKTESFDDIEIPAGVVRIGVFATPSLAFEGRYGAGFDEDTVSAVEFTLERLASVYALYHFRFGANSSSSFYGGLGYTEIDVRARAGSASEQIKESGASFSLGFEFSGFNIEWSRIIDSSEIETDALSLGYNFYF